MTVHFSVGPDQIACGRNNHNTVSISETESVTCKSCRSTDAFKDAQKLIAAPSEIDAGRRFLPKDYWNDYISRLPGKHRLPRGI